MTAFKITSRLSLVLALIVLTAPATRMYAGSTPPTVVTGGDPQPTGEAIRVLLLMPSLVIL